MNILYLTIGWIIFFMSHSLFASLSVKEFVRKHASLLHKSYRLLYSFFSTAFLMALLVWNASISSNYLLAKGPGLKYFGLTLAAIGVITIKMAFRDYSFSNFIGFSSSKDQVLQKRGLLKYIRHPIYLGTILIFAGYFLFDSRISTLASLVCVLGYIPIGIWLEEKKLVKEFGKEYEDYRHRVPALIPRLFRIKD